MSQRTVVTLLFAASIAMIVAPWPDAAGAQSRSGVGAALLDALDVPEADTPVRERPGWKRPARVLVNNPPPSWLEELRAVAPGVEIVPVGSGASAREAAATADAVIGTCNASIITAGPSIRWVQAYGAGVEDCLRTPAIAERGILLTNVQRVLGPAIAEHVMAMALSLARRISVYRDHQRAELWQRDEFPAFTLSGKTMLLAGIGGIGTEVARRAHAFGMTVTAVRNSTRAAPEYVSRVGQSAQLIEFAREADFVVNTLPLTDETRGIFDATVFAAMKPDAWFINVGRGGTVVTADLVEALQSGQIAGAGLDVTDPEPLPAGHPLWAMTNVIITPHAAPISEVNVDSRWLVFRENLRRYVAGDRMLSVVDTSRGY